MQLYQAVLHNPVVVCVSIVSIIKNFSSSFPIPLLCSSTKPAMLIPLSGWLKISTKTYMFSRNLFYWRVYSLRKSIYNSISPKAARHCLRVACDVGIFCGVKLNFRASDLSLYQPVGGCSSGLISSASELA